MAEKVKVKPGDTMSALAKKAGVSLADFIAANPQITNPNLIRPGQILTIPVANPTDSTTDSVTSIRPDAEYDEKMADAAGDVVDQENSTTSNVDNDGTNAGTDSDVQEEVDGFDIEKYTKEYLDKVTEAEKDVERKSAFNILKMEFQQYGLGSLVDSISNLLTDGTPPAEFALRLRGTQEYKDRFKANEIRISKGLAALSPAEYVALEDKYQEVMRNYDLPASYYTKDETGRQLGFESLLASDVSSTELENRIITAKDRVVNANPEVTKALKQFYPDITNGDILAYALDPKNALKSIQSRVTAAEIGGAAMQTGLATSLTRAEELQKYGVDKAAATEGYSMISGGLQRGSELASIYGQDPYSQATAESEVFKLTGQDKARKQRQKVTGLEKATFGGQSGVTSGALSRDRAGGI
jgi:LysM repeat protein